ncbi:type VI secretion lipoprotein TssJ [Serratia sp. T13T92]|jgi:predicted component of type VI protein secretion system|uniref:type VI secretion lipoprotein TssJ n=1 Tax=Serratia sp. T13T92 TaxID=3397496 RepID=UPI0039E13019
MKVLTPLLMVTLIFFLGGCADPRSGTTESQTITQVEAPFSAGAIILNVKAEPGLNTWNWMANSCTLLVIQAQNASSLNTLLSSPTQLKNLFGGAVAIEGLLKVDRYVAMPGQYTTLHIDRSENTRQVAIVAGYYPFPRKQHMALFAIPITTARQGWWWPERESTLAPLTIDITLGSNSITRINGAVYSPAVSTSAADLYKLENAVALTESAN